MSKYEPLWIWIKENGTDSFKLTYAEIEKIAGLPIDHSFLSFKKELTEYNEREERMLSMIYEKFLGSDLTPEEKMQLNAIDKAMLWYDLTFLLGEKQESEAPELHIDLRYEVRAFGEVEEEYRKIFEEQLITVQNKRI